MGRLLDNGTLPIAEIARLARREGARPRPTYQTHRWFARRFALTARALLVANEIDERTPFWDAYYAGVSYDGKRVLDPFMGGGVMLFEAARLGADVYGTDIEPVPAAICDLQGQLPHLPPLDATFEAIHDRLWPTLRPFYVTRAENGEERLLLHAFWAQIVRCRGCATTFTCHPSYRIAWSEKNGLQWVVCMGCGEVLERPLSRQRVRCRCGTTTVPAQGNAGDAIATCPACKQREALTDVAAREGPPRFRLVATESVPGDAVDRRVNMPERLLTRATSYDLTVFKRAKKALKEVLRTNPDSIADAVIPVENRRDARPLIYGINRYSGLHNARQLLHLALVAREIRGLPKDVKPAMAIAFSDHLTTNTMLCAYAGGWRRLTPLFSLRGYRHIVRPVELNPWLKKAGRGTLAMAVKSVVRASEFSRAGEEPYGTSEFVTVPSLFTGAWNTRCSDAGDLEHIADGSIDLALTDPPYMDYIGYSELGHFFVPWLARFGLVDLRHLNGFPAGQLAVPRKNATALAHFRGGLAAAFKAMARKLNPSGRLVFTYQNVDRRGWEALGSALCSGGFQILNVFPMLGESGPNLHKHEQSISWDAVIVCTRGRAGTMTGAFGEWAMEQGIAAATIWQQRLKGDGEILGAQDLHNLASAFAMLLEVNLETVGRAA